MINQILILLCFLSIGCNNNRAKVDIKMPRTSSIDTIKIITDIKKQYIEINSKAYSFNKIEKDISGESTEGGIIIAYYDDTDLRKIVTTYYGEIGKAVTEYYFNQNNLCFVFKSEYIYDKPIYVKGSKVTSVEENRYYFFKNGLLKWVDKNKNTISLKSKLHQQEAQYIIEDIVRFKKILGDYKPNHNKGLHSDDTVRCKYGVKCPDTGYVIKGSRDAVGRIIHVNPKNKNVLWEE